MAVGQTFRWDEEIVHRLFKPLLFVLVTLVGLGIVWPLVQGCFLGVVRGKGCKWQPMLAFVDTYYPWIVLPLIALGVITWLAWQYYRRDQASERFDLLKPASEVRPKDLGFRVAKPDGDAGLEEDFAPNRPPLYESIYVGRLAVLYEKREKENPGPYYDEEDLTQSLSEDTGFVLIGPPSDGKTRTLYEILRRMNDYEVIRLKADAKIPKKADLSLLFKERRVVLLLDDLSNAKHNESNLLELTEKLSECKVASWVVASSCRNGPELTRVRTELGRLIDSISLELWLVGPNPQQKERLAESIWDEPWDPAKSDDYPTLGYIAWGEQAMKPMGRRFANLSTNHPVRAAILRALKLLDYAGISPSHERLRAVLRSEGLFHRRDLDLHESLAALVEEGFLRPGSTDPVQPEPGYLRQDRVVPYVQGRMPEDDFEKLADVLEELEDPIGLFQLSITCMQRPETYERALSFVDRVLQLRPDYGYALYSRGVALDLLGRYEEALEAYEKVLKTRPDHVVDTLYGKGVVLLKLGRYEEALKAFDEALEIRPDYVNALHNKCVTLLKLGRYEEALEACDKVLEVSHDHADALYGKGNALVELGRFEETESRLALYDEALEVYNKFLKVRPDHAGALNNTAELLWELGRYEEALEAFDEALKIRPDYAKGAVGAPFVHDEQVEYE